MYSRRTLDFVFKLHCHVTFVVFMLSSGILQLANVGRTEQQKLRKQKMISY